MTFDKQHALRARVEARLPAIVAELRILLTERPTLDLAAEIVAAVVSGAATRSCPARIAARLRPQLQALMPIPGFDPRVERRILESFAHSAVSELLWPAPRLLSEDDAEPLLAATRPHSIGSDIA